MDFTVFLLGRFCLVLRGLECVWDLLGSLVSCKF